MVALIIAKRYSSAQLYVVESVERKSNREAGRT